MDDIAALMRLEKILNRAINIICAIYIVAIPVMLAVCIFTGDPNDLAEFSIDLAALEGLNGTAVGRTTVSPAFNLTVRVENPCLQPWCFNGGEVLVSYAGVALAWGRVPVLCVPRSAAAELTVLPWGRDVGLSEDLLQRLLSEWPMGTAQVLVEMKIFHPINWMHSSKFSYIGSTSLHSFKFMLGDRTARLQEAKNN
uniref:Uncharacterized protein n=1 Tax=Avena sativa TaxID=4498 RepID=A0ACD5YQ53_AVESA